MKEEKIDEMVYYCTFPAPMGDFLVAEKAGKICSCGWIDQEEVGMGEHWTEDKEGKIPILKEARRQLEEYFAGERRSFDLPLLLEGTPFQMKAWKMLQTIPYGQTVTYGEEARRMGNPKAARAVGGANHNNPISIIVPCHRVCAAGGKLGGYGGGIDRKAFLLRLEKGEKEFRRD